MMLIDLVDIAQVTQMLKYISVTMRSAPDQRATFLEDRRRMILFHVFQEHVPDDLD